jgi:hypothetical protein
VIKVVQDPAEVAPKEEMAARAEEGGAEELAGEAATAGTSRSGIRQRTGLVISPARLMGGEEAWVRLAAQEAREVTVDQAAIVDLTDSGQVAGIKGQAAQTVDLAILAATVPRVR